MPVNRVLDRLLLGAVALLLAASLSAAFGGSGMRETVWLLGAAGAMTLVARAGLERFAPRHAPARVRRRV